MKCHIFRELVNDLRDIAKTKYTYQSLREIIARRLRKDIVLANASNTLRVKMTALPKAEDNQCIVRLSTSHWADQRGLHIKKSLTFVKRKCRGFNLLEEDIGQIGEEEVANRILDLDTHKDGLYEVVTCNEKRDWESGHVEDYDYRLIAFTEKTTDVTAK